MNQSQEKAVTAASASASAATSSVHSEEHQESYAERKKKSARADLESLRRNLFKGDSAQMENIMKEYRNIQREKKSDVLIDDQATKPVNEHKNRYPDVLPFKNTAVKLEYIEGVAGSDYINANYVIDLGAPAERPSQKYICCQAPLVQTFNDFWRMVWEQHAPLIVMITNLVEGNKIKADTYWPSRVNQTLRYGLISVKLTREYHRGHTVMIRTFHVWKNPPPQQSGASFNFNFGFSSPGSGSGSGDDSPRPISGSDDGWGGGYNSGEDHFSFSSSSESDLEPIEGQEVRKVTQLHCTKWPDFGVPESAQVMKDLIYELELRKRRLEDPIIVHCSAGIGRTGTFVAIHMALQKDLHGELISIRDIVRNLRSQRIGMVQSKEQYIFLYGVVAEMLRDRDSLLNIRSKRFKRFSYYLIASRNDRNDAIASHTLHAPTDKSHLFSTSPRLRESVNQHLMLTQSSPFGPGEPVKKGSYFHEKIIDHSLTSSTNSISSNQKPPVISSAIALNLPHPTSVHSVASSLEHSSQASKPTVKSRDSSPNLKVSGGNSLAKSTEIGNKQTLSPDIDVDQSNAFSRPRGRSMPFLVQRSKSEDVINNSSQALQNSTRTSVPLLTLSPRSPALSPRSSPSLPQIMESSSFTDEVKPPSSRAKLRQASDAISITPAVSQIDRKK